MRIGPSARRFLDAQTVAIREKLIDDLLWLDHNPRLAPDEPWKRPFHAPPVVLRIFQDDTHWIIYYIQGNGELMVANIGDRSETPFLHRPDRL